MQERYREQLERQLYFLRASSDAFDAGHYEVALRIATTVRTLFHDSKRSKSLKTHLGLKNLKLLNTCKSYEKELEKLAPIFGLPIGVIRPGRWEPMASWVLGKDKFLQIPKLEKTEIREMIEFDTWWNQGVLMFDERWLSRKNLVLLAANKDGGAHIDSDVPKDLAVLIRGLWRTGQKGQEEWIANYHFTYLRQIAYEVLNSPELL